MRIFLGKEAFADSGRWIEIISRRPKHRTSVPLHRNILFHNDEFVGEEHGTRSDPARWTFQIGSTCS